MKRLTPFLIALVLLALVAGPVAAGRAAPVAPDTAEIEYFVLAECENLFYFVTTSEINNYAYEVRGNGWTSGVIYGMQYPSVRGGTYAVQAPQYSEFAGDYTLRVFFDGGYFFENDIAERICTWSAK